MGLMIKIILIGRACKIGRIVAIGEELRSIGFCAPKYDGLAGN